MQNATKWDFRTDKTDQRADVSASASKEIFYLD